MYRSQAILYILVVPAFVLVGLLLGVAGIHLPWYVFVFGVPLVVMSAMLSIGALALARENQLPAPTEVEALGRSCVWLGAILRNPLAANRLAAAQALAQINDPRVVEPLCHALGDLDVEVRRCAAEALAWVGDPRAVESLVKGLTDPDPEVRCFAADALGRLGDSRAVEPLARTLLDLNLSVKRSAARALEKVGDERAIELLVRAVRDADGEVQFHAGNALIRVGESRDQGPTSEQSLRDIVFSAVKPEVQTILTRSAKHGYE